MPKTKKPEEKKAEEYLKSIGFSTPIFEPVKNSPPDFLIDNDIAVEVRRLNQQVLSDGGSEPIERLDFQILPILRNILESLENTQYTNTAQVILEYSRPLKLTKELKKKVNEVLTNHLSLIDQKARYRVNKNLSFEITPLNYKREKPYILLSIDEDTGGMILNNLVEGLNYVISEKSLNSNPLIKKIVSRLPKFLWPKPEPYGFVLALNEKGDILESLQDPTGEHLKEITGAREHDGFLYLGSLHNDRIGKYRLRGNTP